MKTIFCIALVMSIGLAAGVTSAQDPDPVPPSGLMDNFDSKKSVIQEAKELSRASLRHRIDEMKTVCDLSDVQVKKLELATKGAAIKAISQAGKLPQNGGDAKGHDVMVAAIVKAEDTKVWKRTVKKTLTDDQHKKYEAVFAERLKFQRSAAVQSFLVKVDSKLRLSADQRKQLTEFIDKEYGKELTDFHAGMGKVGGIVFCGGGLGRKKPLENNSPLRKILSEDQQAVWKRHSAHEMARVRKVLAFKPLSRYQIIDIPEMELASLESEARMPPSEFLDVAALIEPMIQEFQEKSKMNYGQTLTRALIEFLNQEQLEQLAAGLKVYIDEIKTVCDLSDAQVEKLKVASTGAGIEVISQIGKIPLGGGDTHGVYRYFGSGIKAEDTKFWKIAVKKTLTDEQYKKYVAVVAERLKFQRTAAAQSFVAKVNSKMLLFADQRKQLTEFIDKEYGVELTRFNAEMGKVKGFVFLGGVPISEKPLEKNSPLRKILSEDQQNIWERFAAPELEMVRKKMAKEVSYVRFERIYDPKMISVPLKVEQGK